MENSFSSIISQSNSLIILLPKNPFFDQVAAGLALYLSIQSSKEVSVVSHSPMTVEFNNLIGVNKIENDIRNKNMVLKFKDYDGNFIDKASANLENGQFYLTVLTKPGSPAPKKENIDVSYSGVSADTVILVGGINESNFPILADKDFSEVKLVHVGNRPLKLSPEKKVTSFTKDASSTSEVASAILLTEVREPVVGNNMQAQQNEPQGILKLDSDIATNLIMGIEESSNRFSAPSVSAETFQIMAELLYLGGRRKAKTISPNQFPPGAIPQPNPSNGANIQMNQQQNINQNQDVVPQKAPSDWLKPKVFTGTTIS